MVVAPGFKKKALEKRLINIAAASMRIIILKIMVGSIV